MSAVRQIFCLLGSLLMIKFSIDAYSGFVCFRVNQCFEIEGSWVILTPLFLSFAFILMGFFLRAVWVDWRGSGRKSE